MFLIVSGLLLFFGGFSAIANRGRRQRGKEVDLAGSALDLLASTRRDWLEVGYIMLIGLVLFVGGLAVLRGEA